jgi:small subunit ribosomal protein S21
MAKITLNPDRQTQRDVDMALRKLKRQVESDGTLDDIRKHSEYVKPSVTRKLKAAAAKARLRREQRKNTLPDKQF